MATGVYTNPYEVSITSELVNTPYEYDTVTTTSVISEEFEVLYYGTGIISSDRLSRERSAFTIRSEDVTSIVSNVMGIISEDVTDETHSIIHKIGV